MRIFHVITSINFGGAENQLMSLVRLQRAGGHAVKVAYLREEGDWRGEMEALGVEVVDLAMGSYRFVAASYRLLRAIEDFGPDVVAAHLQPAELCARLALLGKPASALPLVIAKRNLALFGRLPGERFLARWVASRACALIANSNAVKALSDREGWSPAGGASMVYNGIDPAPYDGRARERSLALRREWGAGERGLLIGTIAGLLPVKALDVLLRAHAAHLKRARVPVKLVVAGKGPLLGELRRLAAELGIEDEVVFAGFRTDVPAVMGAFDVFALTSVSEGCPNVVLEAMASGKPVVATRVGGVPELVADGTTGALCPAGDPEAIARALAFFERPENRRAYGDAGRARVRENFSFDRMYRATMAVYESAAASRAGTASPSAEREKSRA